jgi:sulfopyruvate decarboxylase subunit alpha
MEIDEKLHKEIKKSKVDLILSVPCAMLKGLIKTINKKKQIEYIPTTREEEAVGIAVGAFMGGKVPLIMMQNSGLGNSINALKSLAQLYEIPIIFMMSHRGAEGEKIVAQMPMGEITIDLVEFLNMKIYIVEKESDLSKIKEAVNYGLDQKQSVTILLKRPLWRDNS